MNKKGLKKYYDLCIDATIINSPWYYINNEWHNIIADDNYNVIYRDGKIEFNEKNGK